MKLIDIIKNSYRTVVENPTLTMLFVLFLIGANFLMSYIFLAKTQGMAQLLIFCLFAFCCIFFSGWFEAVKKSCLSTNLKEENFYRIFSCGITKNFLDTLLAFVLYVVLLSCVIILSQYAALKIFGSIDFFLNDVSEKNFNLMSYFMSLPVEQKNIIYGWNFCILSGFTLFSFLTLFYFPAVYDNYENIKNAALSALLKPFRALGRAVKFLFKNFLTSAAIGVLVYFSNMILAIINAKVASNLILSVIFLLIYIYFIALVIMVIFSCYEKKNNSNNGLDGIGENKAFN